MVLCWSILHKRAAMAEWLRRWTRNPMGSSRAGSNPVRSVYILFTLHNMTASFMVNILTNAKLANIVFTTFWDDNTAIEDGH